MSKERNNLRAQVANALRVGVEDMEGSLVASGGWSRASLAQSIAWGTVRVDLPQTDAGGAVNTAITLSNAVANRNYIVAIVGTISDVASTLQWLPMFAVGSDTAGTLHVRFVNIIDNIASNTSVEMQWTEYFEN